MICYEVNLSIDVDIADAYEKWLVPHMKEMLLFNGFHEATLYENKADHNASKQYLTASYLIESENHLNSYLNNHAQTMREEGVTKFGNKFSANRRILSVKDHFKST